VLTQAFSNTHPWSLAHSRERFDCSRRAAVFAALLLATLAGCDARREVREWQPSDHQPPPTVAPEGQGTGATAEEPAGDPSARAAASLWSMRCASCHGETGRGDGTSRPPGAQPPDLTAPAYKDTRTNAELHKVIKEGRNMMPAFGDQLTDLGIEALVAHVRTLSAP
jgi:mono/diheme cytochrome c family protein